MQRKRAQEFARLVREGFRGSDEDLPKRIGNAGLLAFRYAIDGSLAAIAGLKVPGHAYLQGRIRQGVGIR